MRHAILIVALAATVSWAAIASADGPAAGPARHVSASRLVLRRSAKNWNLNRGTPDDNSTIPTPVNRNPKGRPQKQPGLLPQEHVTPGSKKRCQTPFRESELVQSSEVSPGHAGQIIAIGGEASGPSPTIRSSAIHSGSRPTRIRRFVSCRRPVASRPTTSPRFTRPSASSPVGPRTSRCSSHRRPISSRFCWTKQVIYVGGGNTRSMLALWREWGLDRILHLAWTAGIVLCG